MVRLAGLFLFTAFFALAGSTEFDRAQSLYHKTKFEQSLEILQALPSKDAQAWSLIGRNYYMIGEYKKATEALEKAVAAAPAVADHYVWLGRAYGRRAETSSPFTAPGYASKARQNFERAVQLSSKNMEALSDLFEYYLEAPGFLGGGYDKATKVAEQMTQIDESEGHWAQARLAEKKKEYHAAEQQLRRAMEVAPHQVGRVLDLAKFLAKQGRYQESDQTFAKAKAVAPNSPKILFAEAEAYIQTNRNLPAARKLLKEYLSSADLTPDDPPRSDAAKLLKKAGS